MDWSEKSVMITGGTGSFGKAFALRMVQKYNPRKVIIFSRDELKQYEMAKMPEFQHRAMRFYIGDIRSKERLQRSMRDVDIVVHAAALKQVPTCEYNPMEAVLTNINGTKNVVDAALDSHNVQKVVALSTDKAVNPINLYGATKLAAEKLVIQSNSYSGNEGARFACVRYGNVLGSRGSVIPLFLGQAATGTVTVTDDRMTRFWIRIQDAVEFVVRSIEEMHGGEIFVPKMPSMKVMDVAQALAPEARVERIGIRPGEKLHEMLISPDEASRVLENGNKYILLPNHPWWKEGHYSSMKALPDNFGYDSHSNTWQMTQAGFLDLVEDLLPEEFVQKRIRAKKNGQGRVARVDKGRKGAAKAASSVK
jgi:UDP-N-acetylglucosamine 4,6-dehydratase